MRTPITAFVLCAWMLMACGELYAQAPSEAVESGETVETFATESAPPPKLPEPEGASRMSPEYDVWIDKQRGVVLVDGQVSLRRGMLEMFACTRNTKEHESIVSANARAFLVHAALLRLGAEPGHPVQFVPEYKPPEGTEVEISVEWRDPDGQGHTARAQDWIRDVRTGKAMENGWVFAGSWFWTDEETGRQYYQAEQGDFICVSNFSTATLDIPVKSSQATEELAFETFTERIPALGTPVRLVLKPLVDKKEKGDGAAPKADGGGGKAEGGTGNTASGE